MIDQPGDPELPQLDLDDIERAARAVLAFNPDRWFTAGRLDRLNIRPVYADHIAAASPQAILGLVARVRRLEEAETIAQALLAAGARPRAEVGEVGARSARVARAIDRRPRSGRGPRGG